MRDAVCRQPSAPSGTGKRSAKPDADETDKFAPFQCVGLCGVRVGVSLRVLLARSGIRAAPGHSRCCRVTNPLLTLRRGNTLETAT